MLSVYEDFKHMDPATKVALCVGGAAVAVGLAVAFWPKKAAAASGAVVPVATQKWQPTASLTPGAFYTFVSNVLTDPTSGQMLDKFSTASLLSAGGWAGQVLYYPGDASLPAVNGLPLTPQPNQFIFQGTFQPAGVTIPLPVDSQVMTAYQLVG